MAVKQQVVIVPGDQPEEGIVGYGGKHWEKESLKTRVENATRKVNKRSRIRVRRWRRAGWCSQERLQLQKWPWRPLKVVSNGTSR